MADATVYGIDINALMSVAGAQAQGSQKARFCSDIASLLGSNAIFRIKVSGTTKYQSTVVGALLTSSSGIAMPLQFVEPPSTNVADALTDASAIIEVSNAANQTIKITVPVKSSAAAGFLEASAALDGTKLFRTSGVLLTAPASLDAGGSTGSTGGLGDVNTLDDAMLTANDNSWHIEVAPYTNNTSGPGGTRLAYVVIGLRRSDGNSYWPGEYLSDSSPQGVSLSDGTSIRHQAWYVAGRAAQSTTEYANNRLQLRNFRHFALKTDLTWEALSSSTDVIITDASWHANFRSPGNETYESISTGGNLDQIQSHASGAGGGQSLGSIGVGNDGSSIPRRSKWALHGYPVNAYKNRSDWRDNYIGTLAVMEARTIMHNPSGTDQRASNNVLVHMGSDWYGGGSYISANWQGRLVLPGVDWVEVCGHDIPSATLLANPPPGFS